jgi:hypothetical protein
MFNPNEGYFSEDDYSDVNDSSDGENYFNADALGELDDEIVYEVDFSDIQGKSFASSLNKFNRVYDYKNRLKNKRVKPKLPLTKQFDVKSSARIVGADGSNKNISKIIVPDDKRVIVEGVDKFILGHGKSCDDIKNIGYYKCKKLKELIIIMNNNSRTDFNLELFNPSMPLDYLFATSGNLNNKVTVAGGVVSYSDVLYNILANPTHIVNAKFTYADNLGGTVTAQQIAQPMFFKNKRIDGTVKVEPLNTQLQLDVYQFQPDVLFFDFQNTLNRPFIPDGMDVIQYKVLAGASVTFSFFYRQKSLKRFFLSEAKDNRKLL